MITRYDKYFKLFMLCRPLYKYRNRKIDARFQNILVDHRIIERILDAVDAIQKGAPRP